MRRWILLLWLEDMPLSELLKVVGVCDWPWIFTMARYEALLAQIPELAKKSGFHQSSSDRTMAPLTLREQMAAFQEMTRE